MTVQDVAVSPPTPPIVQPPSIDFTSITGERYEKYYLSVNPSIWDKQISLSASSPGQSIVFNSVPMRYFFEDGEYAVSASGSIRVYLPTGISASSDYSARRTIPFALKDFHSPLLHEEHTILKTFDSQTAMLPKTSDYFNNYSIHKYFSVKYTLTEAQWHSFISDEPNYIRANVTFPAETVLSSASLYEQFVHVSRNFYQYKSLTIQFDPDLVIHKVFPVLPTVVSSFDLNEENVLMVTFDEYNEPFTGPIFSYLVNVGDNRLEEKTFSIE
jgi:hypothetical protein